MPALILKSEDFILSAGDNADYIDISFLQGYKNPRLTAVDVYLVTAVGTAMVSVHIKDHNKDYNVSPINAEPLWASSKGISWDGRLNCGEWAHWLAVNTENATANDKVRAVCVFEHDGPKTGSAYR